MENKKTILLMFSGGLDSTGVLYKLLTEKEYEEYDIHVHHIQLKNRENRNRAESIAIENIKKYLKTNNFREFKYSETEFKFPDIDKRYFYDVDIYNFIAGNLCWQMSYIEKVAIGRIATDITNNPMTPRRMTSDNIFSAYTKIEKKFYPLNSFTKQQIVNFLPSDLTKLTWSCRTPIYIKGIPTKCETCMTCRELKKVKYKNGN
jgi:7-cyano-7-deazaguanine synthase in queuosine biosynthesis